MTEVAAAMGHRSREKDQRSTDAKNRDFVILGEYLRISYLVTSQKFQIERNLG